MHEAGNYTISLATKEGIFANNQAIYLKDNILGIETNLSENAYTFNANVGMITDRFELKYLPASVLANSKQMVENISVYRDGEYFVVSSEKLNIDQVELYDFSGRLIQSVKSGKREMKINSSLFNKGANILKIYQANTFATKKTSGK